MNKYQKMIDRLSVTNKGVSVAILKEITSLLNELEVKNEKRERI